MRQLKIVLGAGVVAVWVAAAIMFTPSRLSARDRLLLRDSASCGSGNCRCSVSNSSCVCNSGGGSCGASCLGGSSSQCEAET